MDNYGEIVVTIIIIFFAAFCFIFIARVIYLSMFKNNINGLHISSMYELESALYEEQFIKGPLEVPEDFKKNIEECGTLTNSKGIKIEYYKFNTDYNASEFFDTLGHLLKGIHRENPKHASDTTFFKETKDGVYKYKYKNKNIVIVSSIIEEYKDELDKIMKKI